MGQHSVRSSVNHSRNFWTAISYIIIAIAGVAVLFPLLWMISTSLKPDVKAVFQYPPQLIPKPATWSNYILAWKSAPFGRYAFNSIFVAVTATLLQIMNACLCAYVFSRINFRGRDALFTLFLVVMMVPIQVTVVPLYSLMVEMGWLDSYQSLILPFAANALGTFLIRQTFLSIPNDLIDAAIMDGANHLQILGKLMVPLSKPAIIAFALTTFKWRWNEYFWVIIMTSSDTMRTLPVGVVAMRGGPDGGSNWHIIMAGIVIVLLPMLLLFLFAQRHFVEGVTHSGLKG